MKIKFIGTYHCFSGLRLKIIRKMLSCERETHGQFRIVCKARGIDHANEITKDIGYKVFRREYSSETGNEKELKAFEDNPQVNYIISYMYRDKFITDIELNKILEFFEEETAKIRNEISHFDIFARSICNIRLNNGNKIATFKELQDYIELQKTQASKETASDILQWLKEHFDGVGWCLVETYFREQFGVDIGADQNDTTGSN